HRGRRVERLDQRIERLGKLGASERRRTRARSLHRGFDVKVLLTIRRWSVLAGEQLLGEQGTAGKVEADRRERRELRGRQAERARRGNARVDDHVWLPLLEPAVEYVVAPAPGVALRVAGIRQRVSADVDQVDAGRGDRTEVERGVDLGAKIDQPEARAR